MKRVLLLFTLVPAIAFSQAYPNRTLRMIVPFAPGGASDFVGRILQPRMTELLGQQVVVENRGGAAGNIGADIAAKSWRPGRARRPTATPSCWATSAASPSTRRCSRTFR